MSQGSFFDPLWASKVTLPVKRVGERWEFFYGGDVPVEEGTIGDLTLHTNHITDKRFREQVTQELNIKILDEGAELRVALSDRETGGRRAGYWPEKYPLALPYGTTRFERIWLGPRKVSAKQKELDPAQARGGLWLRIRGFERCELHGSSVVFQSGDKAREAVSLNHAFTLLSQRYEKHRISNTGNVYTRVFYQESNEEWYPLNDLRDGALAEGERKLLADLWLQVEKELGWRPRPPAPDKKSKRT